MIHQYWFCIQHGATKHFMLDPNHDSNGMVYCTRCDRSCCSIEFAVNSLKDVGLLPADNDAAPVTRPSVSQDTCYYCNRTLPVGYMQTLRSESTVACCLTCAAW